jgi:hypothetical protein
MSHISSRTTALAAAAFTFCVASGAPALAKTPTHHQHARVLLHAGYTAAPVTRVMLHVPSNDFSKDCDLPSSGCSDGMRIAN